MNLYDLEGTKKPKKIAESKVEIIHEFAPGQGGGSGNYFQALASAWYNGTFNSKSLQKGIKSQEDVERLLQRGIVCPDGVTRKYGIDYNATFDGVVISSDDYYEHADHDDTDSRTGKPFGPYDYMEFSDDELDEAANLAQQAAIAIAKKKEQGVAEGHADQQRKIFKKNGKPVGEVGIDRESSPGNGQWYMTCYGVVSYGGYDSYEEAVEELKHCLKQGVAEGLSEMDGNGSGRDGSNRKRISTYGTRDRDDVGGKEYTVPPVKAKDFTGKAQDLLNKTYADQTSAMAQKAIINKPVHEGIMDFMQPQQPKTTKDRLSLAAMRQIEKARADKERQDPTYVRGKDLPKNPDHVRVVTDARGDYKPPKEADYGDEYQDMVRRVAAQEKRKQQQPKPAKKEDSNMPVATDSTSPIHGMGEDSETHLKNLGPSSQKLVRTARQSAPDARSDIDAVFTYLDNVAKRTQDNYREVNNILKQLDPLSSDLDKTEQELDQVNQVNQGQQQLLSRLKARLDKVHADTSLTTAQQQQAARDAGERDSIKKSLDQPEKTTQQPITISTGDDDTKKSIANLTSEIQKIQTQIKQAQGVYGNDTAKLAKIEMLKQALADKQNQLNSHRQLSPTDVSDMLNQNAPDSFSRDKMNAIKNGIRSTAQNEDITEDVYESRLYKMKLAGYFD